MSRIRPPAEYSKSIPAPDRKQSSPPGPGSTSPAAWPSTRPAMSTSPTPATNRVVRVSPTGAFSTVATPALNGPSGVAVGSAGDLYIADTGNDRVIHIPPAGPATTIGANLDEPTAVAADDAGNVAIINQGSNNTSVVEVTPTLTQTTLSTHYSTGIAFQPVPAGPAQ